MGKIIRTNATMDYFISQTYANIYIYIYYFMLRPPRGSYETIHAEAPRGPYETIHAEALSGARMRLDMLRPRRGPYETIHAEVPRGPYGTIHAEAPSGPV